MAQNPKVPLLNLDNPPALGMGRRAGVMAAHEIAGRMEADYCHIPAARREAALGLALLWHDHWDKAHAIAQNHEGEGDFDWLHAAVHRREGDFGNAAYWLGEAGRHAAFAWLPEQVKPCLKEKPEWKQILLSDGKWNAIAFLQAVRQNPEHAALRALQAEEFRCFFDYWTDARKPKA